MPRPWVGVPTISRFHGIVIRMYFDDHAFPHFHARAAGLKAKIRIDQIEVVESNLTRKQLNQDGLRLGSGAPTRAGKNWQCARDVGTLVPIEPWQ